MDFFLGQTVCGVGKCCDDARWDCGVEHGCSMAQGDRGFLSLTNTMHLQNNARDGSRARHSLQGIKREHGAGPEDDRDPIP